MMKTTDVFNEHRLVQTHLASCVDDLHHTDHLLKKFKSYEGKEAIRKLRYLLIISIHNLRYGED